MLKPWITPKLFEKCDEETELIKAETDHTSLLDLRQQEKNLREKRQLFKNLERDKIY